MLNKNKTQQNLCNIIIIIIKTFLVKYVIFEKDNLFAKN